MVIMHVLKNLLDHMASENSPGRSNAKIQMFGSRGIVWETRLAFLRHMWAVIF
jgi:hypothetical protein